MADRSDYLPAERLQASPARAACAALRAAADRLPSRSQELAAQVNPTLKLDKQAEQVGRLCPASPTFSSLGHARAAAAAAGIGSRARAHTRPHALKGCLAHTRKLSPGRCCKTWRTTSWRTWPPLHASSCSTAAARCSKRRTFNWRSVRRSSSAHPRGWRFDGSGCASPLVRRAAQRKIGTCGYPAWEISRPSSNPSGDSPRARPRCTGSGCSWCAGARRARTDSGQPP